MKLRDKLYQLRLKEKNLQLKGDKDGLIKLSEEIKRVRKDFAREIIEKENGNDKHKRR